MEHKCLATPFHAFSFLLIPCLICVQLRIGICIPVYYAILFSKQLGFL